MITPQLINFCLVYDPEDWVEGMSDVVKDTPNFEVSVQVYNRDKNGNYRPLKKRDLYTNHHYVPRPKVMRTSGRPFPISMPWTTSETGR